MEGQGVTRLAVDRCQMGLGAGHSFRWVQVVPAVFVFLVIRTRHLFTREPFHQMPPRTTVFAAVVGHADACAMGYTAHQLACTAMATKQPTPSSSAPRMSRTWTKQAGHVPVGVPLDVPLRCHPQAARAA